MVANVEDEEKKVVETAAKLPWSKGHSDKNLQHNSQDKTFFFSTAENVYFYRLRQTHTQDIQGQSPW